MLVNKFFLFFLFFLSFLYFSSSQAIDSTAFDRIQRECKVPGAELVHVVPYEIHPSGMPKVKKLGIKTKKGTEWEQKCARYHDSPDKLLASNCKDWAVREFVDSSLRYIELVEIGSNGGYRCNLSEGYQESWVFQSKIFSEKGVLEAVNSCAVPLSQRREVMNKKSAQQSPDKRASVVQDYFLSEGRQSICFHGEASAKREKNSCGASLLNSFQDMNSCLKNIGNIVSALNACEKEEGTSESKKNRNCHLIMYGDDDRRTLPHIRRAFLSDAETKVLAKGSRYESREEDLDRIHILRTRNFDKDDRNQICSALVSVKNYCNSKVRISNRNNSRADGNGSPRIRGGVR